MVMLLTNFHVQLWDAVHSQRHVAASAALGPPQLRCEYSTCLHCVCNLCFLQPLIAPGPPQGRVESGCWVKWFSVYAEQHVKYVACYVQHAIGALSARTDGK
jgi:hypothetical protein